MQELENVLSGAAKELFNIDVEVDLVRPEEKFGDYSTSVALKLAKQLNKNPGEVAVALAGKLHGHPGVADISIAGPGLINIRLDDMSLLRMASSATDLPRALEGKEILAEFGDPNPFKEMHIGHLYSYIVGDAISSLMESGGADVKRLSYHGDVGLHVAKAIYGVRELEKDRVTRNKTLADVPVMQWESFLFIAYSYGAAKYDEDPEAKAEIEAINLHIYNKDDSAIKELYEEGREQSFKYFNRLLSNLGIKNDHRYLESETLDVGKALVEKNIGSVFKKSEGAIVFEGEKVGLHTRVFITSKGLPTYETKDLGLTELKNQDYPKASRSIIITANEQSEYFKVMLAALKEINPELAGKTTHMSHGFLSLTTGKMSSRSGNVYSARELLEEVQAAVVKQYPDSEIHDEVALAAIKYALLKHRLGSDIVVDIKESIKLDGNSGPYLQYAYARANSILEKTPLSDSDLKVADLESGERTLVRKVSEYPEVVAKAAEELMPHHICIYLYGLAQTFNRFYENNRVAGNDRQDIRLGLVRDYAGVLKSGLGLLGIEAPEKM